jgi:hypothetical protein
MALSDLLTTLAQQAKEAEDRVRSAATEAKADLQANVERAADDARRTADELTNRADAAAEQASGWWAQVQSDWSKHIATVREDVAAKKKAIDMNDAQFAADLARADAQAAVNFASAAIDESEYAVLNAILAQKDADDIAAGR